jgi:hypothetical protein
MNGAQFLSKSSTSFVGIFYIELCPLLARLRHADRLRNYCLSGKSGNDGRTVKTALLTVSCRPRVNRKRTLANRSSSLASSMPCAVQSVLPDLPHSSLSAPPLG